MWKFKRFCKIDKILLRVNLWTWPRRWTFQELQSTLESLPRFLSSDFTVSGLTASHIFPFFNSVTDSYQTWLKIKKRLSLGLAAPSGDEQCDAWSRSDQLQLKASGRFKSGIDWLIDCQNWLIVTIDCVSWASPLKLPSSSLFHFKVGVAGLISPWNLPLYLLTFKVSKIFALDIQSDSIICRHGRMI